MKKYFVKNNNDTYSNDTTLGSNVKPIKSVYYCDEIVNKGGEHTYAGSNTPWFCIKDGSMVFSSGFKAENNKITTAPTKTFYRRIFSCTFDCLTNAWKLLRNPNDTSWNSIRTLPHLIKKELYVGNSPLINSMDRIDEDGNIVGDKLSWRMSNTNFRFVPVQGYPYSTTNWYIEKNSNGYLYFYNGSTAQYTNSWTPAYSQRAEFSTKEAAEHIMPSPGHLEPVSYYVKPDKGDPSTYCWNFNYSTRNYNMQGFNAWSVSSTMNYMFTTDNYHSIYCRPTFKEQFNYETSVSPTAAGLVTNTNNSALEINNSVTGSGPSPSYFTIDITRVPLKYNKLDVVIDGLFYYPANNSPVAHSEIYEDYSDVFAVYNYGQSPVNQTVNCWSYLYKPDNDVEWKYAPKYTLSAIRNGKTVFYGYCDNSTTRAYQLGPDEEYHSDAWSTYNTEISQTRMSYNCLEYVEAFKTIVENAHDTSLSNLNLVNVNTLADMPYSGYTFPSADYLNYSFYGNLCFDGSLKRNYKTPWYNDSKTKYTWEHYLIYDNCDVDYDLEDPKVLDKIYVYCVNTNNNDICKWQINWGNGTKSTGYALWSDIAGYKDCTNLYVTAYSADNTSDFHRIKDAFSASPNRFTSADYNDPEAPLDYRKYFTMTANDTSRMFLKDMNANEDWKTISSRFTYFGAYSNYYNANADYLHQSTRGLLSISSYNITNIPEEILYSKSKHVNNWNKQGFKLDSVLLYNMQNVTMKHQIDLGDRTDTSGFTFGDNTKDYRYLHISYPGTNTLSNPNKDKCNLTHVDMYYKFTN